MIRLFIFFFSLQTNLFAMSRGVKFNPAILKDREIDALATNLQDVKEELKEENMTEIIDEVPDVKNLIHPKTEVAEKPTLPHGDIEENVKEENEMIDESEELEDFIIKTEPVDEAARTGTNGFNKKTSSERRIAAEIKSINKGSCIPTLGGENKPHKCHECGKSFSRNGDLTRHILIHTGEKPHKCEKCGKSFSVKGNLSQHILTHTREKPHRCETCGKSFPRKDVLSMHILAHTGKRTHSCERCGKSFYLKSALSQHILTHTGKKCHKCEKCEKSFPSRSNLSRHISSCIKGRKPHKCVKCEKSFSQKGNLSRHIFMHTGEKPHSCEECGKSFSLKSILSQHILTHTGEKPHNCEECGKSFSLKSNLYKHIRTQHYLREIPQ